jgi:UDP-GlcNAc:undecaprenyl-phosphate GlcNAc-1-phosphate transferase
MLNIGVVFGLALVASLLLTPLARRLAIRMGIVAKVVSRSVHTEPKPFLGGVAMYLAFAVAMLAGGAVTDDQTLGILICGGLIMLLGVVDDKINMKAKVKFIGQVAIAALLVYGFDLKIDGIFSPLGQRWVSFGFFAEPLTILWIVSFVNVMNFIDGLDGLAAGISTIGALTLLMVSLQQALPTAVLLAAALAGSAIGFLRYNFNPAKIFMGDAGSMFLGFTLAAISVHGVLKSALTVSVVVPILALAVPIFDTAFAIIRRLAAGRSIGEADKDHLHHRLLRLGLSHRNTVLVMWAVSAWLGLSAVAVTEVPLAEAVIIVGIVLVGIFVGARKLGLLEVTDTKQKNLGQ